MSDTVASESLDFIPTNTGNYLELESEFGVSRLATLKVHRSRIMSRSEAGSLSELIRMWLEASETARPDTGFP